MNLISGTSVAIFLREASGLSAEAQQTLQRFGVAPKRHPRQHLGHPLGGAGLVVAENDTAVLFYDEAEGDWALGTLGPRVHSRHTLAATFPRWPRLETALLGFAVEAAGASEVVEPVLLPALRVEPDVPRLVTAFATLLLLSALATFVGAFAYLAGPDSPTVLLIFALSSTLLGFASLVYGLRFVRSGVAQGSIVPRGSRGLDNSGAPLGEPRSYTRADAPVRFWALSSFYFLIGGIAIVCAIAFVVIVISGAA